MNVDAHARRRIIPNLDLNLETRGIIDWDYPLARGGEPEEYMNYVPNPKDNFCDVNEYYERRGPPWQWYFNNHDYLGIPNGVGTPEDHRNERFQRLNIHQHWDIPGYRGEGPPNLQAPPYYDPSQWFKCRQYWHYDNASGHCIVCKEETHEKVHGMPAGEENTEPLYQVVCGFCHTKAIRKFPCGYSPRLISSMLQHQLPYILRCHSTSYECSRSWLNPNPIISNWLACSAVDSMGPNKCMYFLWLFVPPY